MDEAVDAQKRVPQHDADDERGDVHPRPQPQLEHNVKRDREHHIGVDPVAEHPVALHLAVARHHALGPDGARAKPQNERRNDAGE